MPADFLPAQFETSSEKIFSCCNNFSWPISFGRPHGPPNGPTDVLTAPQAPSKRPHFQTSLHTSRDTLIFSRTSRETTAHTSRAPAHPSASLKASIKFAPFFGNQQGAQTQTHVNSLHFKTFQDVRYLLAIEADGRKGQRRLLSGCSSSEVLARIPQREVRGHCALDSDVRRPQFGRNYLAALDTVPGTHN